MMRLVDRVLLAESGAWRYARVVLLAVVPLTLFALLGNPA